MWTSSRGRTRAASTTPSHTFADLYMKPGLYITEIIKRLYNSNGVERVFGPKLSEA